MVLFGTILLLFTTKNKSPKDLSLELLVDGLSVGSGIKTATVGVTAVVAPSLWQLGLFFLKIGSILFGSG